MKKTTLCTLTLGLLVLTACGQKGPPVPKTLPTEKTQMPLESTNDLVPVEVESTDPE